MLNYKLKKGNISVEEQYDESLPKVKALIGELNQVWTNLIDNAIDAMEVNHQGKLIIKTEKDKEFMKVTITDDGPGIPPAIQTQIFDPFFTTKDIGKGTGLGAGCRHADHQTAPGLGKGGFAGGPYCIYRLFSHRWMIGRRGMANEERVVSSEFVSSELPVCA